jgi:hypothetical protein
MTIWRNDRVSMPSQDRKTDDLKDEPLYGIIHSVLRDHLERGALVDGLVLGEASVARAFQTSRMPASIAQTASQGRAHLRFRGTRLPRARPKTRLA